MNSSSSMLFRQSSRRLAFDSGKRMGSRPVGFWVMEAMTAHSDRVRSLQDLPKYRWEADSTPRVFCPRLMAFI